MNTTRETKSGSPEPRYLSLPRRSLWRHTRNSVWMIGAFLQ